MVEDRKSGYRKRGHRTLVYMLLKPVFSRHSRGVPHFMDEPTNALDEAGVSLVKDIILKQKQRGALVIVSCHDIGILKELSDEIFRMDAGSITEHLFLNGEF